MAKAAVKTGDIPSWSAKKSKAKAAKTAYATRKGLLDGKTYTSLTRGEKDELLLVLCERFGLLDEDGKVTL